MPETLEGVGQLNFAADISAASDLSDPRSYVIRSLHLRDPSDFEGTEPPFVASSTLLEKLWSELWAYYRAKCLPNDLSVNRELLWLDEDEPCDFLSIFSTTQRHRIRPTLSSEYGLCFSQYFARSPHRVKAFINWDDVHVIPFVTAVDFPERLTEFSTMGLDPESSYFREGEFRSCPPDEYGEIVGVFDQNGNFTGVDANGKSNGIDERDERIQNTAYRNEFIEALGKRDKRIGQPEMAQVRRKVLKVHQLLSNGSSMWWSRREWLKEQGGLH
ncbi:hypothetical protein C8J56DRAFT_1160592 [Mycena floridula]|nr:hypothetical protein C8J56DRAFT_1160592 [Mycena floridula]